MESLLVAILVAAAVWFVMRRFRGGGGLFASVARRPAQPPPEQEAQQQRTMPRFGTPGTITEDQFNALNRNLFTPSKQWSYEEAALILDTVSYLRAVCAETMGVREPALEVQNELLAFILGDDDLREYVREWGERRRSKGESFDAPHVTRDRPFRRVATVAMKLAPE